MVVDRKEYNVSEGCITCHIPAQIVASAGYYNMYMMTLEYTPLGDTIHRNCRLDNLVEPPCGSYIWDIIPPCFHPAHHEDIFAMYRRLSLLSKQPERSEEAASLLCQILHQVTADAYAESCREKTSSVIDFLLNYLYDRFDRHISLNEMAALVHLDKSYLIRLFRREMGQTPPDFLNGICPSHAPAYGSFRLVLRLNYIIALQELPLRIFLRSGSLMRFVYNSIASSTGSAFHAVRTSVARCRSLSPIRTSSSIFRLSSGGRKK